MSDFQLAESVAQEESCPELKVRASDSGLGPSIIVLSAAAIILLLFRSTTWSMVSTWSSASYSHGYLVLPISLWLIYASRSRLAALEVKPNPLGLVLLVVLGFGWLLGDVAGVEAIKQGAVVGMVPAVVWLVLGTALARAMLFPLLFLLFAVPVGDALVPRLQDFTAFCVVKGLDVVGIPVLLERRIIFVPSGVWEVAEACAGLRYLTASLVLGCSYAYVVYKHWTRRLIFVGVSILVPIAANGLRAFGIVLLGHLTHNRLAAGVDHLIYGGVFFGLVIAVLFTAGWHWREPSILTGRSASEPSQAVLDTKSDYCRGMRSSKRRTALMALLGIAAAGTAPLWAHYLNRGDQSFSRQPLRAPSALPPWNVSSVGIGTWNPIFVQATERLRQTYSSGRRPVILYVAYYAGGHNGRKLVSSVNDLSGGGPWRSTSERSSTAMVDGERIPVHETLFRSQEGSLIVWNWYWVDGEFTDNPYRAKFLLAKARLLGGIQESAALAVGSYYEFERTEATQALQDFLKHVSLQHALRRDASLKSF